MRKIKNKSVRTGKYYHLQIIGSIDNEALLHLAEGFTAIETAEPTRPVMITLSSEGGDAYAALGMYSLIRQSKLHITVKAVGQVMSAATIVLAGADHRIMSKDCWFMVHDDDDPANRVRRSDLKALTSESQHYELLEWQWAEVLARHSELSKEEWRRLSKETTYYDAYECINLGLVDELCD